MSDYIGTMGFNTKEYIGRKYNFIAFNTENTILKNKEIRKAIACSINRKAIVISILNNRYYTSDFFLNYGNWIYDSSENVQEYNQEKAKQRLIENGWENKYSTWQKKENHIIIRTNLNMIVNSSNENQINVANSIKEQVEAIGIKLIIKPVNDVQYHNYLDNKNYDMIFMETTSSMNINFELFLGEKNFAKYFSEELGYLMKDVKNITDNNMLKEKYQKIYDIYFEEQPYIGLYRNKMIFAYNQKLMGEFSPNWYNIFYNIESWYRLK